MARQSFGIYGQIAYIIVGAVLFKATFAVKGMGKYTKPIAAALKKKDLAEARKWLPYIVRRDPNTLNEKQITSAAVESIAESTTDGITAPFFFFALFGVPGAFAYRVVNTLDSMVGYKDIENKNIGWFSANLDTVTNYIPARLTAYLMVAAAFLLERKLARIMAHPAEGQRKNREHKRRLDDFSHGWRPKYATGKAGTLHFRRRPRHHPRTHR